MDDRELMQQALDALELNNTMYDIFVARLLRERLSQPEPEPVAWREIMGKWKTHYYDYNEDGRGEPLYAAPVHASDIPQERVDETVKDRHISYVCPNCHWSLDRLSKPEPEQTRSEKLLEAGYTRRPKGWSKEQEPVAWIKEQELAYMSAAAGIGETEWKTNLGLTPEPGDVPLYTAPKEWVGLTDEEREQVRSSCGYNQFMTAGEYADAVQKATEAKLREKNYG